MCNETGSLVESRLLIDSDAHDESLHKWMEGEAERARMNSYSLQGGSPIYDEQTTRISKGIHVSLSL